MLKSKRLVSMFLALVMVFSLGSIGGFAQSEVAKTLNSTENTAVLNGVTKKDGTTLEITDIHISQDNITIDSNGMSAFVDVIGTYEDGSTLNLNTLAKWSAEDQNVVYAYDGRILAQGKGTTTVTVSYHGISKEIAVEVLNYVDVENLMQSALKADRLRDSEAGIMALTPSERDNIIGKASAMFNVYWTPTSNVRGWRNQSTFYAGTTYKGIPYSQTEYQTDESSFLSALNYNNTFYNNYTRFGIIMPRFGNDCSAYVIYVFGLSRNVTGDFINGIRNGTYPKVGSYNVDSPSYNDLYNSYGSLQRADAVVNAGHTFIIGSSNGSLGTMYICYEQTPPQVQYTIWYRDQLANQGYLPFSKK